VQQKYQTMFALEKKQHRHGFQPLAAVPMENNVKINKKQQFLSDWWFYNMVSAAKCNQPSLPHSSYPPRTVPLF